MSSDAPGRVLLRGCHAIATMDDAGTEYRDADLLLRGRTIEAVGPGVVSALSTGPLPAEVIDASTCVVLPGFVNTHHHLFQTLTRVIPAVQDQKLFEWLVTLYQVWRNHDPRTVHLAALVGVGELLLTGCTTTSDHHYLFPKHSSGMLIDETVRAAQELGIRFHPTRGSMSRGRSLGGLPPDDVCQDEHTILWDCERVTAVFHDPEPLSMCRVGLAPCSPFSVTPGLMRDTAEMARRNGLRLHTHLAETHDEDAFCLETYGKRPLDFMADVGWLGEDVWYAHGVHFNDAELARLAETRTGVAHCPTSNMRLGSGTCRVPEMLRLGVPVGLGVDGSASNDASNMHREVQSALLVHRNATAVDAMPARQALWLATRGGAAVLGRDDIGQIAPGKAADVVLFDLAEIGYAGAACDPVAALVFCGTAGRVHTAFVNGKAVVRERRLLGGDERELWRRANEASLALVERTRREWALDVLQRPA